MGRVKNVVVFSQSLDLEPLLAAFPAGTVRGLVWPSVRPGEREAVERLGVLRGLPVTAQPRAADPGVADFVRVVKGWAPDLLVTNHYPMKIRPEVLSISTFGGINIHAGLLPEFRGAHIPQWVILTGASRSGVTVHVLTEGFDEGDVVGRCEVPVRGTDTWVTLLDRTRAAFREWFPTLVPRLMEGPPRGVPQDPGRAVYYRPRTPEDGRFRWTDPVRTIYDLIRALVAPKPGAYCDDGGTREVFECYCTLQAVARRKARATGWALEKDGLRLDPLGTAPSADADHGAVRFAVTRGGATIGRAGVEDIALETGAARAAWAFDAAADDARWGPTAAALLDAFAREELRLPGGAAGAR
ncbi:MAG: hypothetical protein IPI26_09140 [Elusimicrobia bacterium]|nr:hypothetical protein [Elusimicrobiota bacterium]